MTHLNHLSLYVSQVAWFLPVSFFNVQIYFLVLLLVLNTIESDGFLWRASSRLKTLFLTHSCFQTRRSSFSEPTCFFAEHLFWVILVFNQTRGKTRVWFLIHKSHNGEVANFLFLVCLYSLPEKKKAGLAWAYIVLRRILTVFIKIIKLSTVFPNIPFVESGRLDFMFVLNQARRHLTNQGV